MFVGMATIMGSFRCFPTSQRSPPHTMAKTAAVRSFHDAATHAITHLLWDPETQSAAVIDPVMGYEPHTARLSTSGVDQVIGAAHELGLAISWVLETHIHADHLSAAEYLRRQTGAQVGIGEQIAGVQAHFRSVFGLQKSEADEAIFDRLFSDGDVLRLGHLDIRVMHTPGHTADSITYLAGNAAFIGDTLFMPDYGTARADFPGGDAHALYRSCRSLLALPASTRLYLCHDYTGPGRNQQASMVSVAEQRAYNVQIHDGIPEEAFVALRQRRDATLDTPRLMLPALQVNIRGGRLPSCGADGKRYLSIPLVTESVPAAMTRKPGVLGATDADDSP